MREDESNRSGTQICHATQYMGNQYAPSKRSNLSNSLYKPSVYLGSGFGQLRTISDTIRGIQVPTTC